MMVMSQQCSNTLQAACIAHNQQAGSQQQWRACLASFCSTAAMYCASSAAVLLPRGIVAATVTSSEPSAAGEAAVSSAALPSAAGQVGQSTVGH
jgi:hypothetical protein